MEHRWGERIALQMTVELCCGSAAAIAGSLENVSSSGAFVRTGGRGPPRGPVEVILRRRGTGDSHPVRLPAYIVRESEGGVGIEWCEFAPEVVRELMAGKRGAGGARARARALPRIRQLPRGLNTAKQSRGQDVPELAEIGTETLLLAAAAARR